MAPGFDRGHTAVAVRNLNEDVPRRQPEMSEALDKLDEEVGHLETAVDALLGRIGSLTANEPTSQNGTEANAVKGRTDLTRSLFIRCDKIRNVRQAIESALSRLEI